MTSAAASRTLTINSSLLTEESIERCLTAQAGFGSRLINGSASSSWSTKSTNSGNQIPGSHFTDQLIISSLGARYSSG